MECPYCGKQVRFSRDVYAYTEAYSSSSRCVTECCGEIVLVIPQMSWVLRKDSSKDPEDDWGVPKIGGGDEA